MGNMEPKYTYKSGGKVSKKIDLVVHISACFPSKALIDYYCDSIYDQSTKKTENDMWVTGCYLPID